MNNQQLKSYITVVEYGSFSKTSEVLFVSKQALKKQIDSLEDELGIQLLYRNHKGVTTTPAGDVFYSGAKEILECTNKVIKQSRKMAEHRDTIRIVNPPHPRFFLEDAVNAFSKQYPEVNIELIFRSGSSSVSGILSGIADIMEAPKQSELIAKGLRYLPLAKMSYICLLSPSHPLAGREKLCLKDLSGYTVAPGMLRGDVSLRKQISLECRQITIEDNPQVDIPYIMNFCFSQGIYITKAYFASSLPPLISIPLEFGDVPEIGIYYRDNCSESINNFIKIVKELYEKEIGEIQLGSK